MKKILIIIGLFAIGFFGYNQLQTTLNNDTTTKVEEGVLSEDTNTGSQETTSNNLTSNYLGSYTLNDEKFGSEVTVTVAKRNTNNHFQRYS